MSPARSQPLKQPGRKVILRPKKIADAASEYAWGMDAELMHLDAAETIPVSFPEFLVIYAEEIAHPMRKRRNFSIETLNGTHIGSCSYYDIDRVRQEAEVGIIIGDREYWGKGYGSDAVATLVHHVFTEVGLTKLRVRTLVSNVRSQRCFEKCGFAISGRVVNQGYEFISMELYRGNGDRPL